MIFIEPMPLTFICLSMSDIIFFLLIPGYRCYLVLQPLPQLAKQVFHTQNFDFEYVLIMFNSSEGLCGISDKSPYIATDEA